MEISVTKEDIKKGNQGHCRDCPIALAASRAFGVDVLVRSRYVAVDAVPGGRNAIYSLPENARNFINNFDNGRPVRPFRFELGEPVL